MHYIMCQPGSRFRGLPGDRSRPVRQDLLSFPTHLHYSISHLTELDACMRILGALAGGSRGGYIRHERDVASYHIIHNPRGYLMTTNDLAPSSGFALVIGVGV